MKAIDFKPCGVCGQGMMFNGRPPLFYRVQIQSMGIDQGAVMRRHGLELMMGGGRQGAALAEAMGINEDIAKQIDSADVLVCFPCAMELGPLHRLLEGSEG
jgi:hypothetical protein